MSKLDDILLGKTFDFMSAKDNIFELNKSIVSLFNELVGEDESVNMQGLSGINNQYYLELDKETRNKLRVELRQGINKL